MIEMKSNKIIFIDFSYQKMKKEFLDLKLSKELWREKALMEKEDIISQ